ncbi:hypothetical protein M422DRAFT_254113 [Sphaerobolus stellatus SS14]|uniref:Uncharacterized protein n=1 Tax=Sphaerobolus stellatus (strain SS14) TaxID=990650 RepID=A0A0C9VWH0_SPHS4|nr:hypothetical protein M422DRAFT_254113 [Sphaerobolus stellatus SS14]
MLLILLYASVASFLILCLQILARITFWKKKESKDDSKVSNGPSQAQPSRVFDKFEKHMGRFGGSMIFWYMFTRTIRCLSLFGLALYNLLSEKDEIAEYPANILPHVWIKATLPITYNPMTELNPELTASWLSLIFYTFLDPIIFAGAKVSHLTPEELPPLSDTDWSGNLKNRQLDTFQGAKKHHIFFPLMHPKVFGKEYIVLGVTLTVQATAASTLHALALSGLGLEVNLRLISPLNASAQNPSIVVTTCFRL